MDRPAQTYPDGWPRVWRGESSGVMFDEFDLSHTNARCGFFFAQEKEHAQWYAAHGTDARGFVLEPGKCLDLRDPVHAYLKDPLARQLLNDLRDDFDEWVDRTSGEDRPLIDWLESGTLYAYEGDGRGQRWNALFRLAWAHGFDSVVALDATDAPGGGVATTWVVKDPSQIHFLPSPKLSTLMEEQRRSRKPDIESTPTPPVKWTLRT